jgi:hypothetical protein
MSAAGRSAPPDGGLARSGQRLLAYLRQYQQDSR